MAKRVAPGARAAAAIAALALLTAAGGARAVDLPPAPELPPADASADPFAGWYLRGDIGAGFGPAPELRPETGLFAPAVFPPYAAAGFRGATLSPSGSVGGGVGYAFSGLFRADATLEYRFGGRYGAVGALYDPAAPGGGPVFAADRVSASVASVVALVNGSADLGTYWGVTPFVGAGIGVARNSLSSVSDAGFAVAGGGASPVGGLFANASRTNFAWALTAGLGVDVAPNLRLELSYRYLDLGRIALGGGRGLCPAPACFAGAGSVASRGALVSNDIRLGLVWMIGEPAASAPVVARY